MAVVKQQIVIEVPIDRFYDLVVDYERYPEFVPGIKGCTVKAKGPPRQVEYELDLGLKRIKYTLRHDEEKPRRVAWSLVSGEMMKVSNGSWELEDLGGRTRAHYAVEVQIAKPPLIPQAVVDKLSDELTRVQLPRTLAAFKARAEKRP
jgi:ribosome-associated toxin RatA of RatAB toxin-antitoxin module